jgi:hypothetical protein
LDDHKNILMLAHTIGQKTGAKTSKILLLIDQCAAYPKNATFLSNIKVIFLPANYTAQPQPLYLGITHAFRCHYRKQLILKTAATVDGVLLQDATQMKLDMLSAMHFIAEAWIPIAPTYSLTHSLTHSWS